MIWRRKAFIASRDPDFAPVVVSPQRLVMKVQSELAQLPQVIGDILARISHRAIRLDYDLIRIMLSFLLSACSVFSFHHPASLVAALVFENDRAADFEFLERMLPEMQVQNLFLARQQVVTDVESRHSVE